MSNSNWVGKFITLRVSEESPLSTHDFEKRTGFEEVYFGCYGSDTPQGPSMSGPFQKTRM